MIPEPNGEQVVHEYTLGHLLDKLDELTARVGGSWSCWRVSGIWP